MYIIREAQDHQRNVELYLYMKVCQLVRPSIFELSWKIGQKDASISWPNLLISFHAAGESAIGLSGFTEVY